MSRRLWLANLTDLWVIWQYEIINQDESFSSPLGHRVWNLTNCNFHKPQPSELIISLYLKPVSLVIALSFCLGKNLPVLNITYKVNDSINSFFILHLKKIHSESYWYYCSHNSSDCCSDNEILEIWIWKFSSGINLIDWIDGCVSFKLGLSIRKSEVNHHVYSCIEDILCFARSLCLSTL